MSKKIKRIKKEIKKIRKNIKIKHEHRRITKTLFFLSLPVIFGLFLQTLFNIVDTIFVGKISAEALAAVSLVFPVVFIVITFASGLSAGINSIIARLLGMKKRREANIAAENALFVALIFSFFFILLGYLFARKLFILIGGASIIKLVLDYFYLICPSFFFTFLSNTFAGILRGEKDTKTPTKYLFIAVFLNIILDALFIFVLQWGVKGAALATLIARGYENILFWLRLVKGKSYIKISPRYFRPSLTIIKDILKLGLPTSLAQTNVALSMIFLNKIISYFGPYAIAAYGIAFKLDSIAFMPSIGIAIGTITLIGHFVGAKKMKKAKSTVYIANIITATFMELVGIIFFLFPKFWISLFNTHPKVLQYGISYIHTNTLSYAFMGLGIIVGASYLGYGKAMPGLILAISRLWLVAVPLAYILAVIFSYGVLGVWISLLFANIVSGVASIIWLRWIPSKIVEKEVKRI